VRPLTIGVFHALGDFKDARRTSVHHATFLERYEPANVYVYHDARDPVTPALRSIRFDAILLDVTFLCYRWSRPRGLFEALKDRYRFLADQDAVRIAFPQDEYDHGAVLDAWLEEYRTDVVYTVLFDARDLIFERASRTAEILPALTGYADDHEIERMGVFARAFPERSIDVGYRARDLPPEFGRHGQLKAKLGDRFKSAASGRSLRLDVSSRAEDVLLGDRWLAFLGDTKFTLGSEGGSSVWDPHGRIKDAVHAYVAEHPGASYEDVESACLDGATRDPPFSAISPRLFEVAAARSAQILVRAPYLGVLRPGEHYLSLEPDLSNASEVLDAMHDPRAAERMIEASYEALIASDRFRYRTHAREVMAKIREKVAAKSLPARAPWDTIRLAEEHRGAVEASHRARTPLIHPSIKRMIPGPILNGARPVVRMMRRWITRKT
jgi:hypothetical protein